MSTAALQGDPRRPGALHPFVRATATEDDRPADYYALLALVFGLIAFSSRLKELGFLSMLMSMCSFAHLGMKNMNLNYATLSFFFSVSSIVTWRMTNMMPLPVSPGEASG